MKIKQDPVTKLYCREDGAVLMPPTKYSRFNAFRWTFGSLLPAGYRRINYCGKTHLVHQIICRAFNGIPPADKPFVDHIDRCKANNNVSNLHWVSAKENCNNKDYVDRSVEKYKVRRCDDVKAYDKAYHAAKRTEMCARGLSKRKGPDGKWGWYPRIRTKPTI